MPSALEGEPLSAYVLLCTAARAVRSGAVEPLEWIAEVHHVTPGAVAATASTWRWGERLPGWFTLIGAPVRQRPAPRGEAGRRGDAGQRVAPSGHSTRTGTPVRSAYATTSAVPP